MTRSVVVLVSGGIESSFVLVNLAQMAKSENYRIYPIHFNYGQKNYEFEVASIYRIIGNLPMNLQKNIAPLKIMKLDNLNIFNSSITGRLSEDVQELDRNTLGKVKDTTNVPFRNIIFISIAVAYTDKVDATQIYIGCSKAPDDMLNTHYDSTKEVLDMMADVVRHGSNGRITLETPLIDIYKSQTILLAKAIGIDLNMTRSCYSGNEKPCGKCRACIERQEGMKINGFT